MGKEFFIARRIYFNPDKGKSASPPAITIAVASIALGLAVMIVAVAIIVGFKKEVRNKVIGFGSHIQVSNIRNNSFYETEPIAVSDSLMEAMRSDSRIAHVEKFVTKPGIIKTDEDFYGIVVKGIDEEYDWSFFSRNMVEGDILSISPDSLSTRVIISKTLSDKLLLKLGDSFITCFIQEEALRTRKFTVAGIYRTNFSEYDKLVVLADIKLVRRLNQWDEDMVTGLEILVNDYEKLQQTTYDLYYDLQGTVDRLGNHYFLRSIRQLNPMIFDWLDVLDLNVVVILVLMLLVAGFSMISGLLIIILERTNMIGILKALGQNNGSLRKVFLYLSVFLIGRGLFWGNIVALSICLIQKYTGVLKMNPETYYLSEVPVDINLWSILLINFGTLLVILLILIGPSYLIAKISPAKTIRFE